ncbi:Aspartate aminotransferase [Moraxella caprae]|uniref:Aspartate aminotransferase n=1 Tax=Moraxella caprae TaxID=90240 RepID=A0A378QYM3_9GAMM|nr:valine--pyruvate transaminase [Moraxella caprae]STZ08015.1 Aspartate aminotransferase [Moraxella caprae]
MNISKFGKKFTQNSGILQLMDDLGNALNSNKPVNMLGGGNPANIASVNDVYLQMLKDSIQGDGADSVALDCASNYSNPQGDGKFITALVDFFNRHYDWGITKDNIALTNGSQNAFFYLFNLFGGAFDDGDKSILLPLAPEYIGYADTHIDGKHFIGINPRIELCDYDNQDGFFKYKVDFDALENLDALKNNQIGAICCSRPTNPTGNVLTDDEMARLDNIAQAHNIPLIIDNAYGMPFPNIIHTKANLVWHDNIILCFSLSKVGLAGVRTGIVIAKPEIIKAISSLNAIVNLAPCRFGASIVTPLINNDKINELSLQEIRPFYLKQAHTAIHLLKHAFKDLPQVKIHKPEGAIFLWIWFENLPISTQSLYEILKEKGTLIIPSEHFFVGIDTSDYRHAHECIRMSIAQPDDVLEKGIKAIGEVVRGVYKQGTEQSH